MNDMPDTITLTVQQVLELIDEFDSCECPHGSCDVYPHPKHQALVELLNDRGVKTDTQRQNDERAAGRQADGPA